MARAFMTVLPIMLAVFPPALLPAQDDLSMAEVFYEQGTPDSLLESADLCAEALESDPESYEAAWKAARAYSEYCRECMEREAQGWEEIAIQYGRMGMMYAEKAIALGPEKIEGHFWFGRSAGSYTQGAGIRAVVQEDLQERIRASLEKSCEIDRHFMQDEPVKALGRFWFVLPPPLRDLDRSLAYLDEYNQSCPDDAQGQVFLAEALIDAGGRENRARARDLLYRALTGDREYFRECAARLLDRL